MSATRILAWRPGRYLQNSSFVLVWMIARALAQATMVVALSRMLGATGYGRFVAILAIASFLTPIAGLGLSSIVLRDGVREPERLDAALYAALRCWAWTTAISGCAAVALAWLALPRDLPWKAVPAAVIAEVVSVSLTELLARAEQARHRLWRYGAITAGLPLTRLILLAPYALLTTPTLGGWLWLYAIASVAYALLLAAWLGPKRPEALQRLPWRDGLPFSVNALSMRLQAEFNKPALARISFEHAGNFSAAQRAVDIASLPLVALQEALWPRLYAQGDPGRSLRILGGILLTTAAIGGAVLWALSHWAPLILGRDFQSTVASLQMLAWLPMLQVFRALLNFHVIQRRRVALLAWAAIIGAITSIGCVAWSVPRWAATGAVISCYVTEAAMTLVLIVGMTWTGKSSAAPVTGHANPEDR